MRYITYTRAELSRLTNWRQSALYKAAVEVAFAPYTDWKDDVTCFWCGHLFGKVDPCHVFGTQAHPRLKMNPLNILPGCRLCHGYYDDHPVEKADKINEKLPGRIAELERLIRARSSLKAR